ncbi:DUF1761 domain-containing protein [Nonomuraea typhae]|uniref:DUF1761 domain-containing protein n=1 Tax=Nonomuraea typhae TaxID=2603600 RepID=UPI0012F9C461|nr:DUF1761 domain-containing protein [Nonomuraea typhae]
MSQVNWLAVMVAALSAFALGALWYSPILFGKSWMALTGLDQEALAKRSPVLVFGSSFLLSLLAAAVFAMFLGSDPSLGLGVGAGVATGLAWVAASYGINYLFEARPFRLFLVNGGYHALQFTLYGVILGLWH